MDRLALRQVDDRLVGAALVGGQVRLVGDGVVDRDGKSQPAGIHRQRAALAADMDLGPGADRAVLVEDGEMQLLVGGQEEGLVGLQKQAARVALDRSDLGQRRVFYADVRAGMAVTRDQRAVGLRPVQQQRGARGRLDGAVSASRWSQLPPPSPSPPSEANSRPLPSWVDCSDRVGMLTSIVSVALGGPKTVVPSDRYSVMVTV